MRKNTQKNLLTSILTMLFAFVVTLSFVYLVKVAEGRYDDAECENLELVIRRALAACYAEEGVYPPDIDYICTHYGVQIDREKYNVFYEVFAENLMPEITVTERK